MQLCVDTACRHICQKWLWYWSHERGKSCSVSFHIECVQFIKDPRMRCHRRNISKLQRSCDVMHLAYDQAARMDLRLREKSGEVLFEARACTEQIGSS